MRKKRQNKAKPIKTPPFLLNLGFVSFPSCFMCLFVVWSAWVTQPLQWVWIQLSFKLLSLWDWDLVVILCLCSQPLCGKENVSAFDSLTSATYQLYNLGKFLVSVSQFPCLLNGDTVSSHLRLLLWILSELIHNSTSTIWHVHNIHCKG